MTLVSRSQTDVTEAPTFELDVFGNTESPSSRTLSRVYPEPTSRHEKLIMLLYNIGSQSSFDYILEYRRYALRRLEQENHCILVVGVHCSTADWGQHLIPQGRTMADELGGQFMAVSLWDPQSIRLAFDTILRPFIALSEISANVSQAMSRHPGKNSDPYRTDTIEHGVLNDTPGPFASAKEAESDDGSSQKTPSNTCPVFELEAPL
jgi:hypothetical protein